MNTLYIVRGLPGSKAVELAKKLTRTVYVLKSREERPELRTCIESDMRRQVPEIAISGAFAQSWEVAGFFRAADAHGYNVHVVESQTVEDSQAAKQLAVAWESTLRRPHEG